MSNGLKPKAKLKTNNQSVQASKNFELEGDPQDVSAKAEQYNNELEKFDGKYKEFKPNLGRVLVRLQKNPFPITLATAVNQQTGSAEKGIPVCWYSYPEVGHKCYGIVVASSTERIKEGSKVVVAPNAVLKLVGEHTMPSEQFIFASPDHQEEGFFLIMDNMIEGTY